MSKQNPLCALENLGQSVWLDFIRRGMLSSGELLKFVEEDGVSGVTSNPAIFEKAIGESHDYDVAIRALARAGQSAEGIYQTVSIEDVGQGADLLRPVFERTQGVDGFVSLEVSPYLAYDTAGTLSEARRFWKALDRPNVFIKVPATREGLPAIRQLISEGINVNVTLLFGLGRYREVAEAYIAGLEERAQRGQSVRNVASVASFFISRIDTLLDSQLAKIAQSGGPNAGIAASLQGQIAIASAKVAYQIYRQILEGARFQALADQGARVQRLLWASTGTKNPVYSDVKYVEALIGPHTVNTLPLATLAAYREHGEPRSRLEESGDQAGEALAQLERIGIDLDAATQQLEQEGVQKFIEPHNSLLALLEKKRSAAVD